MKVKMLREGIALVDLKDVPKGERVTVATNEQPFKWLSKDEVVIDARERRLPILVQFGKFHGFAFSFHGVYMHAYTTPDTMWGIEWREIGKMIEGYTDAAVIPLSKNESGYEVEVIKTGTNRIDWRLFWKLVKEYRR